MAGGTNEISRSRSVLSVSRALKQLVAASKGGGTCGGRIEGRWRWKMESRREGKGRKIRLETFLGFISAIRDGFPPKRKDTRDTRRNFSRFPSSPSKSAERSLGRENGTIGRNRRKVVS